MRGFRRACAGSSAPPPGSLTQAKGLVSFSLLFKIGASINFNDSASFPKDHETRRQKQKLGEQSRPGAWREATEPHRPAPGPGGVPRDPPHTGQGLPAGLSPAAPPPRQPRSLQMQGIVGPGLAPLGCLGEAGRSGDEAGHRVHTLWLDGRGVQEQTRHPVTGAQRRRTVRAHPFQRPGCGPTSS